MTKNIVWRLKEQPTVAALTDLVAAGLLSKDEAKTILFSYKEDEQRDIAALEKEIKFLRELVEKLAHNKTTIVETIRTVEKPYKQEWWYVPYANWCGGFTLTAGGTTSGIYSISNATNAVASCASRTAGGGGGGSFSSIKTF